LEEHAVSIFRVEMCRVRKQLVIYTGCKEGGHTDTQEGERSSLVQVNNEKFWEELIAFP
jgi:hypothetical protein